MKSQRNEKNSYIDSLPSGSARDACAECDIPSRNGRVNKIKEIWHTARGDFNRAAWKGKLTLGGLVLMATYEWGPGNETAAPIVGGRVLGAEDGLEGIALTGGVTGGFVAGQQLASGYLARKTAGGFPNTSESFYHAINEGEDADTRFKPFDQLSTGRKFLYSFTLGSSFNVLRESAVTGKVDQNQLKRVGRKSSLMTGGAVAVLGSGVEIANQSFEDDRYVQFFTDSIVKNPVFWLGVMGAVLGTDYIKNRRRTHSQD